MKKKIVNVLLEVPLLYLLIFFIKIGTTLVKLES